ncbi:MAG: MarR family transcriptional regulator [Pseudomonadota bacterium]
MEKLFSKYANKRFQEQIRFCAEEVGLTPPEAQILVAIGDEGELSSGAIHRKSYLSLETAETATNRLITRRLVFSKRTKKEQTPRFYLSDEGAIVLQRLKAGHVFPY